MITNLFVFAVIFGYFAVPKDIQPRVLLLGILGALVFRGIFIAIGAVALSAAHWVIYIFGAFLVITAYRLATSSGEQVDPSKNKLLLLVNRFVPSPSSSTTSSDHLSPRRSSSSTCPRGPTRRTGRARSGRSSRGGRSQR